MTITGHWDEPQPDPPPGLVLLLSALQRLAFRAGEPGAWAAPLAEDPIAFLLDTVGEVVNVWTAGGELVYSNHAATDPAELDGPGMPGLRSYRRGGRRFERRALGIRCWDDGWRSDTIASACRGRAPSSQSRAEGYDHAHGYAASEVLVPC